MQGFSDDGYIIDQNFLGHLPYHGFGSDLNGCGWIAAYNFLHRLGYDIPYQDVLRDMNAMFRPKDYGPTPVPKLRRYLAGIGQFRYSHGRNACLQAAQGAEAGILRYWEGRIPHFITFVRNTDGSYRFMNVDDGLEDFTMPVEEFFRTHCRCGWLRLITDR